MSRKALENTNEMCSCPLGILKYSLNRINSIWPPYRCKGLSPDIRHLFAEHSEISSSTSRLVAWAIFPCVAWPAFEQFCMCFELEFEIINSHPNNFKDPEVFIDPLYAIDTLCYRFASLRTNDRSFSKDETWNLGRFPFVRTDRPDHSRRNGNFTFNQDYPTRSVKS